MDDGPPKTGIDGRTSAASADGIWTMPKSLPDDLALWPLRTAIAKYREIAARGGWQAIPFGNKLELGRQGPRLATADDIGFARISIRTNGAMGSHP